MSTTIPFSYNWTQWLAAGGETAPGIQLYDATAYLLEGYLVQVRGVVLQSESFSDNSTPTFYNSTFVISNDYIVSDQQLLVGIAYERDNAGGAPTASPGHFFVWPNLVTVAQMGLLNLGEGLGGTNPLSGPLTLCFSPAILDPLLFLIQGNVRIS